MAEYVTNMWQAQYSGPTRRDRRGCSYDAYVPDPLVGWTPTLPSDLAADIADAEMAIARLNHDGTNHVSLEGVARFLLRAESVASSKIEGLHAGPRRLVAAEAALARGGNAGDHVAVEVLGNIAAMQTAIDLAMPVAELALSDLHRIHRVLMDRSPTPDMGGHTRESQNWIGGSSYNPCSAAYVPPPPEHVGALMKDLVRYTNTDDHSPLVQAAVAHAQFETIHPYADGNGRTGRALIHVIFRRRGLAPSFVPPISLVLATWSDAYVAGLTTFRHIGEAVGEQRSAAAEAWLRTFVAAATRACDDAQVYADRINELTNTLRTELGRTRRGSAVDMLIGALPGVPLLTVESAAQLLERSRVAVSAAVNRLVDAGILVQRNVGKQRYRVFEAPEVLSLFTALERALASPAGDTAGAEPVRPVPQASTPTARA